MKNLVWFCLGIVTGRGLHLLWHIAYWTAIVALAYKALGK